MYKSYFVALLAAAAVPALAQQADEKAAVIQTMQQWEVAVETGDYERLAKFYTHDAIYYPNHSAPLVGRDKIIERNRQRGARGTVEITQRVDNVELNGDWAVYSCLAQVVLSGDDAERYVRVLLLMQRGEDGQWRIHRDIDNQTPETFAPG